MAYSARKQCLRPSLALFQDLWSQSFSPLYTVYTHITYTHSMCMCAHSMPSTCAYNICTHNMGTPTCMHSQHAQLDAGTDLRVRWLEGKIHSLYAFGFDMLYSHKIQGHCRLHARRNSLAARTNPLTDIPRPRLLVIWH